MARPKTPVQAARIQQAAQVQQVSGNLASTGHISMASSAQVFKTFRKPNPKTDRASIAKAWQVEAYRQVNICGEARYAATLFAAIAGRAEIGVSEPNALARKAVWVTSGPEVEVFNEIAPTVRDRSRLIRDYMLHRVIAGECYLVARERQDTDPGFISPPDSAYTTWSDYLKATEPVDVLDPEADLTGHTDPNTPIWEIVAVTEIQKIGDTWEVRHSNGNYVALAKDDPVIRLWNPDPANRDEAWSPFRSLLPTLREIEWLTGHIFKQVRTRLMSAGVWFLPDNLTFPPPPPDALEGDDSAAQIAGMNEAEQFMLSLAASGSYELDMEEVSFPTVVMGDAAALDAIDQDKLIKFWSDIDDKAMVLRSDAVRRFALGMDMPPEQVLGSSGLAVSGTSGSAGSVNHWGEWAKEEQTIKAHIEPALDDLVGALTSAVLRTAEPDTDKVIGYDTAALRMRQDRSKEAIELYDRGLLNGEVTLREVGFDPASDRMTDDEFKRWLLTRLAGGSATPEQVQAAFALLGVALPAVAQPVSGNPESPRALAPGQPGRNNPPSLEDHPYEGPPREQHDHSPAPYSALTASCEGLVLRALEKAGNRLLNDGKRGRDKDRETPPHMAHVVAGGQTAPEFDFMMLPTVLGDRPAADQAAIGVALSQYCTDLYDRGEAYSRESLIEALGGVA